MCAASSAVSNRSAPAVSGRSRYGSCSAAVCEPNDPSQNRSPAAPDGPEFACGVDADRVRPSNRSPPAAVPARPVRAGRRGPRRSRWPGRPSRGRSAMPSDAAWRKRDAVQVAGLPRRQCAERRRPNGVVGIAGHPAVAAVTGQVPQPGHACREQRRRHHRRVGVDPGEVHGSPVAGPVELAGGRRASFRPVASRPSRRRGSDGHDRIGPPTRPRRAPGRARCSRTGPSRSAPGRCRSRGRARPRRRGSPALRQGRRPSSPRRPRRRHPGRSRRSGCRRPAMRHGRARDARPPPR